VVRSGVCPSVDQPLAAAGVHWRRRGDGPQNAALRPALGKPVVQSAGDRALFPALATLTSKAGCRNGLNRPLIGPTALKTPLYAVALACVAARALAQTPAPPSTRNARPKWTGAATKPWGLAPINHNLYSQQSVIEATSFLENLTC
jgi:hypothetical protein